MKTARFVQVVERCGAPQLHTLWLAPEKDPEFQRALKAERVMTIHQETVGTKKDFGTVGFEPKGQSQFLIFPKSLKPFSGMRIVGVKFDLVHEADVPFTPSKKRAEKRPTKTPARPSARTMRSPRKAVGELLPFDASSTSEETVAPKAQKQPERSKPVAPPKSREPAAPVSANSESSRTPPVSPNAESAREARAESELLREVRRAMKELEAGKAVAAYQRLANATEHHSMVR